MFWWLGCKKRQHKHYFWYWHKTNDIKFVFGRISKNVSVERDFAHVGKQKRGKPRKSKSVKEGLDYEEVQN